VISLLLLQVDAGQQAGPHLSYFLQWKRSFSSHLGLSSCRMTRVRKIFLPKLTTTNGSMSKLKPRGARLTRQPLPSHALGPLQAVQRHTRS
jgi:hypothetical protein